MMPSPLSPKISTSPILFYQRQEKGRKPKQTKNTIAEDGGDTKIMAITAIMNYVD